MAVSTTSTMGATSFFETRDNTIITNIIGHVTWQPWLGLWSWYPVMKSSLSNSFEDQAPLDDIYQCLIFQWTTETWLQRKNTRTCPLHTEWKFRYWAKTGPGRVEWRFRELIFKLTLMTVGWGISCEIALRWMSLDITDDKSTFVQGSGSILARIMAWCH